ncbi:hypothetical protein E0W32_10920 [Neisseria meningitidis]|nr:hypothetical protein [Neisseria meningitidis]
MCQCRLKPDDLGFRRHFLRSHRRPLSGLYQAQSRNSPSFPQLSVIPATLRHYHGSGNLETQSCKNLSEMTETQRTWIPAYAGMTKPSARKPAPRHSHESGNLVR